MTTQTNDAGRFQPNAKAKREFGDFQTPDSLAREICQLLAKRNPDYKSPAYRSIVEPTCGIGGMLHAAIQSFPSAQSFDGFEINAEYVNAARTRTDHCSDETNVRLHNADFFTVDWNEELSRLTDPLLIIGNPPWVTNAELGKIGSSNLPSKVNTQKLSGIEAVTGKSNFDICEAVLRILIVAASHRRCTMAMLCKNSVARRVLQHCWTSDITVDSASIHRINSRKHFGASVNACLLVLEFNTPTGNSIRQAHCFDSLIESQPAQTVGWRDDRLIADLGAYGRYRHLLGIPSIRWRSGIKHDCARVMELQRKAGVVYNGLNEPVDIEPDYVFPMLKGSQIGGDKPTERFMIVTQQTVGQSTEQIAQQAPRTWSYLNKHRQSLTDRKSRIYLDKPPFSIFGVGPYSFAPYKVAISSLHRKAKFHVIGKQNDRPIILDDTAYFLPCESQDEASKICKAMNSDQMQSLLRSLTFPDAKRSVTAGLLNQCDYAKVR